MSITLVMCGLLFGGALAWLLEGIKPQSARWVSLLTSI